MTAPIIPFQSDAVRTLAEHYPAPPAPDLSHGFNAVLRETDVVGDTDDRAERRSVLLAMQEAGYQPFDWTPPRGSYTALQGSVNTWLLLRHTTEHFDRLVMMCQCEDPFDREGVVMASVQAYCERYGMTVDVHRRYPWFWPGYVTCVEIAIDVAVHQALPDNALYRPKKRKRSR